MICKSNWYLRNGQNDIIRKRFAQGLADRWDSSNPIQILLKNRTIVGTDRTTLLWDKFNCSPKCAVHFVFVVLVVVVVSQLACFWLCIDLWITRSLFLTLICELFHSPDSGLRAGTSPGFEVRVEKDGTPVASRKERKIKES